MQRCEMCVVLGSAGLPRPRLGVIRARARAGERTSGCEGNFAGAWWCTCCVMQDASAEFGVTGLGLGRAGEVLKQSRTRRSVMLGLPDVESR